MSDESYNYPASENVNDMMPAKTPKGWDMNDQKKQTVEEELQNSHTKHGMYASIPMVCRAEKCPFAEVCWVQQEGKTQKGTRCDLEVSMIVKNLDEYKESLEVDEKDRVDMGLIRELIDLDVQMHRAEMKLAIDGDFMPETVIGMSDKGDEITQPMLHKATDYKEKVSKKRHSILQLLHSTRKDKASDKAQAVDNPSTYASDLMRRWMENKQAESQGQTIEGEYEDVSPDEHHRLDDASKDDNQ